MALPPVLEGLSDEEYVQTEEFKQFHQEQLEKVWELKVELNEDALEGAEPVLAPLWLIKVQLTEKQAVVAFPKMGAMGCGYLVEHNDPGRNLPLTGELSPAWWYRIAQHIDVNRLTADETDFIPLSIVTYAIGMLDEVHRQNMAGEELNLPEARIRTTEEGWEHVE